MMTVSKDALVEHFEEYLRTVQDKREELVITDGGVPVFKIVPFGSPLTAEEAFRGFRGKLSHTESLTAPTDDEWPEL
ncbi:MAG TPA: hypothetical protein VGI81_09710 [Tepidisphaeraceae bacterium]|jgi:prevent-host-death family protein